MGFGRSREFIFSVTVTQIIKVERELVTAVDLKSDGTKLKIMLMTI